jgi:hypothetical protein
MNWQPWVCTNPYCAHDIWLVQRNTVIADLWSVAAQMDDAPFSIAAPSPICPLCATLLLTQPKCATIPAEGSSSEEGPVFDFLRSLS